LLQDTGLNILVNHGLPCWLLIDSSEFQ